jgi:hypothetical protein
MISTLIPVYNFEVGDLVESLISQYKSLSIPFEIVLLDDFSELKYKEKNRKLDKFENVRYQELDQNIGRAKIRNKLADLAKYEYLLFLDCDSEIQAKDFIQNYINNISTDTVTNGGTIVTNEYKSDECILRWQYETKVYQFYKRFPQKRGFTGNNFFIPKSIFKQVKFNEEITSYGYEDSIFAIEVRKKGYSVKNIMNPVVHIGLETNSVYLTKIECAILNLYKYYTNSNYKKELTQEVKLLKFIDLLTKTKLIYFVAFLFRTSRQKMKNNLLSKNPKIRYFNFYKVAYFCFLKTQPKKYSN